jgi:DNA-binding IclR family transcriptional regulator
MKLVKAAANRSHGSIEALARKAPHARTSFIGAELNPENGPPRRVSTQLCEEGRAEQEKHAMPYRPPRKLSSLSQQHLRGLGLRGQVPPVFEPVAAQCRQLVRLTVVCDEAASKLGAVCPRQSVGANVREAS